MDRSVLKSLLREIKDKEYSVPSDINAYELSLEMMNYMGDTDGEMRNDLAFDILVEWIMTDVIKREEAYEIFLIALDENHLFNGLGEIGDSVFDRSFCVEVVACIIYKHRERLSEDDILNAFNKVIKLYNEDIDVRGYVKGKSWAHSAAHGADALYELANCEVIGYKELKVILNAILKKIKVNYYGYINYEDERMICVFKAVLERELIPIEEIQEWIRSLGDIEKKGKVPDYLYVEFNVSLFLKSLYFRLVDHDEYKVLALLVKDVLKETSRFGEDY